MIRITGACCVLLWLLSLYFFLTREKTGNYHKLVSYEDLYSPEANTPSALKKWDHALYGLTNNAEIRKAREMTRKYAGVSASDPAFTKLLKIGSWLSKSYRHCLLSQPDSAFSALSLTDQYYAACRAASPIWCGTFGTHFFFFCSANGLISRTVEKKRDEDHHLVNETYIPELKQWVFTDLTYNTIYCKDTSGKILNIVDILRMNLEKDSSTVNIFSQENNDSYAITSKTSRDHWQRYFHKGSLLNFYYRIDQEYQLSPVNKLIHYAFPAAWYETYSLTPPSNTTFYFRIVSLYLGIITTIIFIVLYLKRND